jgi:hypothetical protein
MNKIYYVIIVFILIVAIFNVIAERYVKNEVKEKTDLRQIPVEDRIEGDGGLEDILSFVTNKANDNDIKIIPSFGTLLGLEREKEIIKHDYDIDLFLFEDDWDKLKKILEKEERFHFEDRKILWHRMFKISDKKTGLSSDFFILYENKGSVTQDIFLTYTGSGIHDGKLILSEMGRKKYTKEDILPLKKTSTKYGELYFPNKPENLLVSWYGEDWETPRL